MGETLSGAVYMMHFSGLQHFLATTVSLNISDGLVSLMASSSVKRRRGKMSFSFNSDEPEQYKTFKVQVYLLKPKHGGFNNMGWAMAALSAPLRV